MRKWVIALAGIFCLAAVVCWRAPAGWGLEGVRASARGLQWSDSGGTVWQGRAEGVRWQGLHLGQLAWRFGGLDSVAALRTRWTLRGRSPQYDLQTELSLDRDGRVDLRGLGGHFPASWIDLSAALPFVYLQGRLELDLERISLAGNSLRDAAGTVRWAGAGLAGARAEPLGDLELQLRSDAPNPDGRIHYRLVSLQPADLWVEAEGWIQGGRYSASAQLRIAPHRRDLMDALAPLGDRFENGTIWFHREGQL